MILGMNHWHFGYEQIVQDCRNEDGSVLMLCNADVDAMASARILSYLLRSDGIPYQLYPCTNYQALESYLKTNESVLEEVEAIVMLNFGASKNLTRLFESQLLTQDLKVYVMDCRKPVHLANIYAGENIVVFMDDTTNMEELPSDGDNLSGGESTSDEEGSSEEGEGDGESDEDDDSDMDDSQADEGEEEAGFDDVEGDAPPQPMPQQDPAYDGGNESDHDDEHDNDNDDDDATAAPVDDPEKSKRRSRDDAPEMDPASSPDSTSKRQKLTEDDATAVETDEDDSRRNSQESSNQHEEEFMDPRELHKQRLVKLRQYYSSGSFFGCPSAYVAYRLAAQLRFGDEKDLLWLACVGVTDAYLHARLDLTGFAALSTDLKESIFRLFPNDMYERVSNTVYAEDLLGTTPLEGDESRTRISLSDNGRIIAQNDFRFFLLRQSSLLESMVHSDYISTKFQVWTKKGMQRLQELLAKMGYPLDECKQPFHMMKPSLKRQLQHKLVENGPEYELGNWQFTSFFRITGYQSLLSASDTSYAVTALLECETPTSKAIEDDPLNQQAWDEEKMMVEAFNIAYDALNCNTTPNSANGSGTWNGVLAEGRDTSTLVNGGSLSGSTGLGAGLRMAMTLQKLVINTAVSLVDREAITRLRHFRYAYLNCTSAGENKTARSELVPSNSNKKSAKDEEHKHHVFAKPLALTRLAHFLMDMHRENGKWTGGKSRPLVLLAEKPRTGTYLVVGYEYPERAGTFMRNTFGNNFELTAKSMNGTFRFDSFDSNVVEVNGDDVQRFIEQLHYLMDSI
ncbi:unnamed protein product [Cylindrotheca closterium]|uniref:Cell division control protein 45 n=1 Tax=Cylindrotheca closterium TaxID=2856 RepID=A0AAD2CQR9_9STRA|nr:unnamed protein product [Cylindrotheca closterium]